MSCIFECIYHFVFSHVAEPKHPKNQMLALKVLVNLFKSSQRASQLLVKFSEVIFFLT